MIFTELNFLFLFLPATVAGFLLVPPAVRELLLVAMSLVFYSVAGVEHVFVLLGCMVWTWAWTVDDRIIACRWRLTGALVGPLAVLFYYKYLGFFIRDVLGLAPIDGWTASVADKLLPAGISFFTFHLLAFAFDRYHGLIARQPPLQHFMLYISFFPHLVAGPILRYREIADALDRVHVFRPTEEDWRLGIGHFCCGLVAKVLVADGLAAFVQPLTHAAGALSPAQALYVVFAYSFQIYFDFWGYTLMATGLAHLFGFRFPRNFDRPYDALNPRDFWRRWHMTLGRWFRDYLYIPLGGRERYLRNILFVFIVCGFWHGAAWQFAVWGLYHGLLIVAYHGMRSGWDGQPLLVQRAVTFTLVSLGWTLFLFDFPTAWTFLQSLLGLTEPTAEIALGAPAWAMLAVAGAACFLIDVDRILEMRFRHWAAVLAHNVGLAALFTLAVLFIDRANTFIYFRF